jgi:iron-sulfur cluster repair protein YtfE (RIC family)
MADPNDYCPVCRGFGYFEGAAAKRNFQVDHTHKVVNKCDTCDGKGQTPVHSFDLTTVINYLTAHFHMKLKERKENARRTEK